MGERHIFDKFTFSEPSWCNSCNGFLWGLREQGFRCRHCAEVRCRNCRHEVGECLESWPWVAVGSMVVVPPQAAAEEAFEEEARPVFLSLLSAFKKCRPNRSDLITDKEKFAEVAQILVKETGDINALWSQLDVDGNDAVGFPEFVEWAEAKGVKLPTGVGGGKRRLVGFPPTWTGPRDDATWNRRENITDATLLAELQSLLEVTYKSKATRDRKSVGPSGCADVPKRFELVRAARNENHHDWRSYYLKRHLIEQAVKGQERELTRALSAQISEQTGGLHVNCTNLSGEKVFSEGLEGDTAMSLIKVIKRTQEAVDDVTVFEGGIELPPLSKLPVGANLALKLQVRHPNSTRQKPLTANLTSLYGARHKLRGHANEWLLFHGASAAAAQSIFNGYFATTFAGSSRGSMYGAGIYLADSITRADEFAEEDEDGLCCVLVCRAIGGRALYNDDRNPDSESLRQLVSSNGYHSILGDREKAQGTFKEYIVFDADQIFVEYVIFYRRQY